MANHNLQELDAGQLEMMWNFLRFGYQEKPHIPAFSSRFFEMPAEMKLTAVVSTPKNR